MPSSAELARARRRRRRADWSSATATLLAGGACYLVVACLTIMLNRQPQASLLRQADLAITPADGIAVVAALLAVVLSINLALAVMTRPDDPIEEVLSTDWQIAMGLVCLLCAGFSVMTVLMCWFSSERSHSWGALVGATTLAVVAVMLAALIWTRARAYGYAKAEIFRLRRRRRRLIRAMDRFQRLHPHPQLRLLPTILLAQLPALFAALVSTTFACLVALAGHQPVQLSDVVVLAVAALALQAPVLLSGCLCWLLPYAEGTLDRLGDTIWTGLFTLADLVLVVGLATVSPGSQRLAFVTYGGVLLAVPAILLVVDRRLGRFWLTAGLRAFAGRQLAMRLRQTRRELEAARKMRRRLRPKPTVRGGELQAVPALGDQRLSSGSTSAAASSP